MRHAITKMAHVHFATNAESARRLRQLGEDPAQIHVVGSPGLDHLRRRPLLDRAALERGARRAARRAQPARHLPSSDARRARRGRRVRRAAARARRAAGGDDALVQPAERRRRRPRDRGQARRVGGRASAERAHLRVARPAALPEPDGPRRRRRRQFVERTLRSAVVRRADGRHRRPPARPPRRGVGDPLRGDARRDRRGDRARTRARQCSATSSTRMATATARAASSTSCAALPPPATLLKKTFHVMEASHG